MCNVVCPRCEAVNRVPADRLEADWTHARCAKCASPLLPAKPVEAAESLFRKTVERSGLPVVVDFWAAWCGPCRMMAPAFAEAAEGLSPHVRFLKVDTDAEQAVASSLGIRSIPTMILFKDGREVARQAGAMSAGQIATWIRQRAG